jgi:hypothetical protein
VPCAVDEPSDHAGRKLTRYDVVDAMDRRLRDGQLAVKRSHWVSGNRRKDAPDLDIYLERVTGIEPALSAWEADVLPLNYTRTAHAWLRVARPWVAPTSYRMTGADRSSWQAAQDAALAVPPSPRLTPSRRGQRPTGAVFTPEH